MIFKAKCMVCNETLEWEQSGDTSWGILPIEDQGCAEVTVQDPSGTVRNHMAPHHADGSYLETLKQHKLRQKQSIENMVGMGLL